MRWCSTLRAGRATRKLFQRAVEIALQSRSGDAALAAARAWKETLPESRDARRFELQILIALNRIGETAEPLRAELAATPQIERPFLMAVIARNYARATDKKLAASVVEQALADELKSPATGGAAWATVGRLRLAGRRHRGRARSRAQGPGGRPLLRGPALLALELMDPGQPLAEPMVKRYLAGPKALPELRIAYARVLVEGRRYADASAATRRARPRPAPNCPSPGCCSAACRRRPPGRGRRDLAQALHRVSPATQDDAEARSRGLTQAYLAARADWPSAARTSPAPSTGWPASTAPRT